MTEENTYPPAPEGSVRLNKFLASCGYESRRAADRLIAEGRVEVNGKAVDTPGLRVLPTDFVKVDGRHATPKEEVVVLLNKPRGYVCSRDAQGAIGTVYDLLPAKYRYANYIGRLDADSEGLLLFTNNGVLSQSIGHPKGGIEKEYWVTLDQAFDSSVLIQLLKGVRIPEGQAKAKYVSRLSARRACVVLEQGLKRQVRQMFSCLGFRVKKLVRVRIGSLWGGDLEPGHATLLDAEQIAQASTNPRRRKGLLGAKQVFKPRPQQQQEASPADEDDDYIFNLADFETEEEALESSTKFTDGEAFEPERDNGRRPFGKAPRAKRDSYDNRNSGFGRERRSFGNREGGERRGGFGGERRSFGNREGGERRGSFGGERRSFGNREGGERRGGFGGERRSFGNREGGERRGRFGGERRSFGNREGGERRGGFGGERRSFDNREGGERRGGFGGGARKSFRSFNKRRPDHR
ncbi:MAG: rRNA pseudouridine synthase [Akkermansia sp.]|nr:rRNA pseudouridine synthase [Akkermansia sp.]